MDKLLLYDGYDRAGPHIFPIEMGQRNQHIKLATEIHPAIAKYIADAKKIPGKSQLLVDALGSGEWWGANRNGDFFPGDQLSHRGRDYGYETFMHYAYPFRHHANKNPANAYGDRVILSVYHPKMHRVQLIIAVHDHKCRDILDGIDNGNYADVSMGTRVPYDECFPKGTFIVTSSGYVPIEEIRVGDLILTHTGSMRKVTRLLRRTSDELIEVSSPAFSAPVKSTRNHRYLVVNEHELRSCRGSVNGKKQRHTPVDGICSCCSKKIKLEPRWVHANDLRVGDYLVHPIHRPEKKESVSDSLARLCGYYLGDGTCIRQRTGRKRDGEYKLQGLSFTSHENDESHIQNIVSVLSENAKNEPKIHDVGQDRAAVVINVYDQNLARHVTRLCGVTKSKHLPLGWKLWSKSEKLSLLGGLIDADGSQDHNKHCGAVRFTNANPSLAEGVRDLCLTLGIPASLNGREQNSSFGKQYIHTVYIPASYSEQLCKYAERVRPYSRRSGSKILVFNDYALYPITRIELYELDKEVDVYNLSVEDDESYVVHGAAVHNCSICHNRAKNRKQYCNHLKYQMSKILSDGRRVMAINHRPKFFDISFVLIGAEKASHVLMKVAQQGLGCGRSSAELGEKYYTRRQFWKGADLKSANVQKRGTITKEVPMKATNVEKVLDSAPDVKSLERPLPPAVVNALSDFPLSEIFSTLAFLGIDPKPEEFQKIILVKAGHKKTAAKWGRERKVFDEGSGSIPSNASQYFDINPDCINEKIAYLVRPYIADRSCFTHLLLPRLEKFANDESQWYPNTKMTLLGSVPLAAGIAGLYTYLKQKAPKESMTGFDKALSRHPWLLGLLFALGTGAITGGVELFRPRPFNPDGELDTYFGHGYNPHNKTASKKILIPLAMAPLAYMYSGMQRARARRGKRLGRFDRFIAQRPDLAAIASLIAGPAAVGKGQQIARGIKRLTKTSGVYQDFALFALTSGAKMMPAALLGSMVDATIIKKISEIASKRRKKHANPR